MLEQHQKNLQLEKQNAECTVDKLKTWRAGIEKDPLWGKSVTYLREQSLDFDWNKRLHSLLLQSAEENSKIGDLQEKMNQITEISHSSIEALNTARTRAQKALQNQHKTRLMRVINPIITVRTLFLKQKMILKAVWQLLLKI